MQAQKEDPRYRDLDRMLARAYIELQRQRIQQKRSGVFMPRMDLCDDPNNPYITAMLEVPGMKAEHLSVRIEHGRLIVEGERTADAVSPESEVATLALYPVRELKYGKFRREINLPAGVNAVHVRSTLVEGMLTISWPRDPATLVEQPAANHSSLPTTLYPSNTATDV
ncbi:HSP20-like chaperone [Lentinus tigrinus ALCF2SS1-7]|uniref:HSP20-like chaperone n=1 Tax=Lentinus tigrinus ALCF2SS1-6 TaxID=1328759 RepID=A0A5C2RPN1_9APHY|nr:HSP20-like chaperone [Lentinus tigrinus ALCF2SS1-6]RPD68352.1 HSP20-like chaperone [Lentinus tigrinus ALCF2SS1-7]